MIKHENFSIYGPFPLRKSMEPMNENMEIATHLYVLPTFLLKLPAFPTFYGLCIQSLFVNIHLSSFHFLGKTEFSYWHTRKMYLGGEISHKRTLFLKKYKGSFIKIVQQLDFFYTPLSKTTTGEGTPTHPITIFFLFCIYTNK